MGAIPARMNMKHVIECREGFSFGNQVQLFVQTSIIVITQFKAAINNGAHGHLHVKGVARSQLVI